MDILYAPLNFSQINIEVGQYSPSVYHTKNTIAFDYWWRSLYQRLISRIKFFTPWKNDSMDYFRWCIYGLGFICVFEHEKYGFSFQPATLSGYDFYYRPTEATVANPLLSKKFKIGEDCEILKLTPDYIGIFSIISYFAAQLAELDTDLKISMSNDKVPNIIGVKNKTAAQTVKKIMDSVNQGDSTVVYDYSIIDDKLTESPPFNVFENAFNYGKSAIGQTETILRNMQTVLNNFDAEIGITTVPYQKKERMVTSEAESKQNDSTARLQTWVECFNQSTEVVKEHFDEDIHAEIVSERGGEEDVKRESDTNRTMEL